jgi:hypothetical protein
MELLSGDGFFVLFGASSESLVGAKAADPVANRALRELQAVQFSGVCDDLGLFDHFRYRQHGVLFPYSFCDFSTFLLARLTVR